MSTVLYVAQWSHSWEIHGVLGVYTTLERAQAELARCAPWSEHEIDWFVLDEPGELQEDGRRKAAEEMPR